MNRKERKAARRAERENAAALAKASEDAAALNKTSFATLEESNAALAEASRVIDMKEAQKRMAKKTTAKAGGAKSQRKSGEAGSGKLPSLPRAAGRKRERPTVPCACGCGGTTKARFCPGHDSYLRGLVLRVYREVMTLDDVEKMIGGKQGKEQRAAVEHEMKEMKKAGKLTKIKVAAHVVKEAAQAKEAKGKKAAKKGSDETPTSEPKEAAGA